MYFKFGLNTTGISQSHFRKFSACSKTYIYYPTALRRVLLRSKKSKNITLYWYCRGPVTQVYSQRARAELERTWKTIFACQNEVNFSAFSSIEKIQMMCNLGDRKAIFFPCEN